MLYSKDLLLQPPAIYKTMRVVAKLHTGHVSRQIFTWVLGMDLYGEELHKCGILPVIFGITTVNLANVFSN